ncbi:MAG: PDZ domain-containing protein [Pirellulales bacterium]
MRILCSTLIVMVTAIFSVNLPARAEDIPQPAPEVQSRPVWIGVVCYSAGEAMRTQLKLPAGQGLLVSSVAAGGPAANAGILQHDVLLTADNQNLGNVPDLLRSVEQAGSNAITVELLRGGERIQLQVTPEVRPATEPETVLVPGEDRRALREWVDRLEPNVNAPLPRRRLHLRFAHPGLVIEAGPIARPWPADLQVSVERDGNRPMKISVRRGDQTWDVSPDQLGNLPELVRPFVEGMLGGAAGGAPPGAPEPDVAVDIPHAEIPGVNVPEVFVPENEAPAAGEVLPPGAEAPPTRGQNARPTEATVPPEPRPPAVQDAESNAELKRRLEEIQRQLEQLQAALREAEAQEKSQE